MDFQDRLDLVLNDPYFPKKGWGVIAKFLNPSLEKYAINNTKFQGVENIEVLETFELIARIGKKVKRKQLEKERKKQEKIISDIKDMELSIVD